MFAHIINDNTGIEFFTEDELQRLSQINVGTPIVDTEEDYSKWLSLCIDNPHV